ncbi:hypothetical protein VOLCADRAFT_103653 [Volvox carteri f. nagariensis]|uniref:F-box domain-containing protein n=1 Tax=Volvox carteri f. nagariensis TaxID=3068 RepID=D8TNM3_VOLCA|nr:uncharacterized protein VOLCADRAFT_103653 [Volvox carteri f. nagariensis]EFJ51014.1 hypothetical protein VOLCADRAFT_103653 [Volvox carteri f. nagariensis]|eukprot:XP_002948026.1 hypothetical protein VOLCADRAFT_103653 [Volvox carteri f. nagariensis]
MSLALVQEHVDRAVRNASDYMFGLAEKIKLSTYPNPLPEANPTCYAIREEGWVPPAELLQKVFGFLDVTTLVNTVQLVCKAWRAEVERYALENRASRKLLDQRVALASLGPPVSASHLYLAMCGRNLLRNPGFRRDCNTQLLELGRQTWNKWKRDAWVVSHTSQDGLSWEQRPVGFISEGGCGTDAPAPPVPYGGGGVRLGERVQQQLKGLLNGWTMRDSGEQRQQQLGVEGPELPTCIATSADWCEVVQVVDLEWELRRRGLTAAQAAHLLDAELSLRLTVHVGSRSDCLGQFCVGLVLDEGNPGDALPQIQSFVMRPSRYRYFSGKVRCAATDGWQRFEHHVAACPRGFRRALVLLRGRRAPASMVEPSNGGEPLPAFCGAKFASAELVFE